MKYQFSYCLLVCMFCSKGLNSLVNHVHERTPRFVYDDHSSSYSELIMANNEATIYHQNNIKVLIKNVLVRKQYISITKNYANMGLAKIFYHELHCEIWFQLKFYNLLLYEHSKRKKDVAVLPLPLQNLDC